MKRYVGTAAFTLVELSIVLVILGLLVGGVLAGQSLIRAAELRAVGTEFTGYKTALNSFRDKYFALPGDMPNAVRYWGAQAGATTDGYNATCASLDGSTPATDAKTCNGNGDSGIGYGPVGAVDHEHWRAWQHLATAGLVAGTFTGVGDADTGMSVTGQNIPRSKYTGAGWGFNWVTTVAAGNPTMFAGTYGNTLVFGKHSAGAFAPNIAALKPEDAYNIDMKMDDGNPTAGITRTVKSASSCLNAGNDAYLLTGTAVTCSLIFISGY